MAGQGLEPRSHHSQIANDDTVAGVVIASGDWQSRALLRAQLIEEGCAVRAYESLRDAADILRPSPAGAMDTSGFKPGLVVADLSGDGSSHDIDQLSRLAQRIPVWVMASRSGPDATELSGRGFERVLFRPIDMRDLVESIKQRLG